MEQLRFTIGLVLFFLVLLIYKFITAPFSPANMLSPLVETLGILVVGLIWGVIIWLPVRLFKGVDEAPDFQNFIFYAAVIFGFVFMVYSSIS